ncbi:MAG: ion channel [Acidimicrobiia bacterium]
MIGREGRLWPAYLALDSYGTVLVLLILTFVLIPVAEGTVWRILLTMTSSLAVLATYRASQVRPQTMRIVTGFVAIALVASLIAAVASDTLLDEWVLIPVGLLLLAGPWVALSRVLRHRTVTAQTILGAICAYVYFGLIFAIAFGLTDAFSADPFFAQGPITDPGRFSYFSFVTISTLGYGDLSPATPFGQNLAVIEALTGSIYLVTLVGRLVGLYGNPAPEHPSVPAGAEAKAE